MFLFFILRDGSAMNIHSGRHRSDIPTNKITTQIHTHTHTHMDSFHFQIRSVSRFTMFVLLLTHACTVVLLLTLVVDVCVLVVWFFPWFGLVSKTVVFRYKCVCG